MTKNLNLINAFDSASRKTYKDTYNMPREICEKKIQVSISPMGNLFKSYVLGSV